MPISLAYITSDVMLQWKQFFILFSGFIFNKCKERSEKSNKAHGSRFLEDWVSGAPPAGVVHPIFMDMFPPPNGTGPMKACGQGSILVPGKNM